MLTLPLIVLAAAASAPAADRVIVTGRAWAPFISPMGEPFRARTVSDDTLVTWFQQADRDHDGSLTVSEMQADAERFFATLDTDQDGEIDPTELNQYELEIAPEIQVTSRMMPAPGATLDKKQKRGSLDSVMGYRGALQGGARYGLLNMPEPVAAADTDFNRGVSLDEFRLAAARRFQILDSGKTGRLTLNGLQVIRTAQLARKPGSDNDTDSRVGNGLPSGN